MGYKNEINSVSSSIFFWRKQQPIWSFVKLYASFIIVSLSILFTLTILEEWNDIEVL